MISPWPAVAGAVLCVAAGFAGGYSWEHRARQAEVEQIRADVARREAQAAEDARRRIEAAQAAAEAAIAERDRRLHALDATNTRLRNDIKTATTGRPCLSGDARRVLHGAPAFKPGLSAPAAGALGAAAAAAADTGQPAEQHAEQPAESSDADVAGWIIDAAALYEQCRARIDAIRQWSNGVSHGG